MDETGQLMAKIQSSVVVPIMYKMVHTGKLSKFMQKKINEADKSKKEMIDGFLNMFGIDQGGNPWITKQSIYNQFYSDLVTKVQHGIDVPGTTIHVFYAIKMGKNMKRDIGLISKIRIYGDTICSMKNCFAAIVQNGWKK